MDRLFMYTLGQLRGLGTTVSFNGSDIWPMWFKYCSYFCCFFDRSKDWAVQIRPRLGKDDLVYDFPPSALINPDMDVLNNRVWVVQERYLLRWTLQFTTKQVFWECGGESACETCPGGYPRTATDFCPYELKQRGIDRSNWGNLVSQYSAAHLTQSSDRLVAIRL